MDNPLLMKKSDVSSKAMKTSPPHDLKVDEPSLGNHKEIVGNYAPETSKAQSPMMNPFSTFLFGPSSSTSKGDDGPRDPLMESASRVMGSLAKNIMEGATPMMNSLIMANLQKNTMGEGMYERGDTEDEKNKVLITITCFLIM